MIRNILKMGDSRLLRVAKRVERFSTPELTALIEKADALPDTVLHLFAVAFVRVRFLCRCRCLRFICCWQRR